MMYGRKSRTSNRRIFVLLSASEKDPTHIIFTVTVNIVQLSTRLMFVLRKRKKKVYYTLSCSLLERIAVIYTSDSSSAKVSWRFEDASSPLDVHATTTNHHGDVAVTSWWRGGGVVVTYGGHKLWWSMLLNLYTYIYLYIYLLFNGVAWYVEKQDDHFFFFSKSYHYFLFNCSYYSLIIYII